MPEILDVRSLACPGPVIALRKLLDAGARAASLWVADDLARSNVTRFATSRGAEVRAESRGEGGYLVSITVSGDGNANGGSATSDEPVICEPEPPAAERARRVLQLTGDTMGTGNDELGALLLRGFVKTVTAVEPHPDVVIAYNAGVRLCCHGSPVLQELRALEARGVTVVACGTCLDYYGLSNRLAVGRVTDMLEIVSTLSTAGNVIRP